MAPSPASRPDATFVGVTMIVASVLMISFGDAVVKWISGDLTLWQIFVTRSLLAIPLCLLVLRGLRQPVAIGPGNGGWVFLRCLLQMTMWVTLYVSLPLLSLPVAAAAMYTAPLFIAFFSALLIGEPVGPRRGFAIALGFLGVLIIVKPGSDAFSYATLLPLLSAVCYALAMIITRGRCRDEDPFVLALCLSVMLLVSGMVASGGLGLLDLSPQAVAASPFVLGPWIPLSGQDWAFMAVLAVLIVGAAAAAAKAYQSGPPVIVATFDYSYLIFAILWSALLFSELPDRDTLAGMAVVFAAGLLVLPKPKPRLGDALGAHSGERRRARP
ncbi:MAG TPA: DMT family transporter [Kiloniellaceae bacterium]|nr:DMT family transporter [Kiloniellaceae bacterium]